MRLDVVMVRFKSIKCHLTRHPGHDAPLQITLDVPYWEFGFVKFEKPPGQMTAGLSVLFGFAVADWKRDST
jgi:hypothetical protein